MCDFSDLVCLGWISQKSHILAYIPTPDGRNQFFSGQLSNHHQNTHTYQKNIFEVPWIGFYRGLILKNCTLKFWGVSFRGGNFDLKIHI